uniref:ADAM metallopeptidase domain 32 n=1 Tax=Malurus cyaneus samueli TaxID=2593467 RepID=A0A8C5UB73_9PASS
EGRPYTIHLQQHAFLSDDFQTYMSSEQGSLRSDSAPFEGGCHYRGYIEGSPSSAVTLSICSGLRGLLQFENVSYGIEPLGYSPAFRHVVYRVSEEQGTGSLLAHSPPRTGLQLMTPWLGVGNHFRVPTSFCFTLVSTLSALVSSWVVFQYNYMGSDPNAVTQKIIQAFNLINNMFNSLNVTIVLSSLELWAEGDKISTAGDTDDLLQRFLQWKQLSLEPRAHDIASFLGYRDQGGFMGAVAPGEACHRDAAATVALYPGNVTLESFSVLLAQVLGRSLGMSPDGSRGCSCPGRVCVMSPEALHLSGAKAFSNCSVRDFETFLKQGRGACLFDRPRLARLARQSRATCGNRVVEPGEQCDCGTECLKDRCCSTNCRLKPTAECASGLCCKNCQLMRRNAVCRAAADAQCDLPEFCSGSSASCPADVYVQDGHNCARGTGYCYRGRCQSLDLQCKQLYGRGTTTRAGCAAVLSRQYLCVCVGYTSSANWLSRNLRCGKLICTYPSNKPFPSTAAAVIYARVREHLCVSLNYLNVPPTRDPILVSPGTKCGSGKVCINKTCHPHSVLGSSCDSAAKCHGHGVCNNKGNCHCHPGWQPPDCSRKGSRLGGSVDCGLQLNEPAPSRPVLGPGDMAWLVLGSSLVLLVLTAALCLGLWRQQLLARFHGQQPPATEG